MPGNSTRASQRASNVRLENISFSHSRKLAVPSLILHDSSDARNEERIERNAVKWTNFFANTTYLVQSEYSLARSLGIDPESSLGQPDRLIAELLTPNETDLYKAWKRDPRRALPGVSDWRALRVPLTANTPVQRARWRELTSALRVLYHKDSISPESCKGWVEKYKRAMPLLIAAKKVEQARRDADAGQGSSTARRFVHELIACRCLVSDIGKYRIEMNALLREFNKAAGLREADLVNRIVRLENENPSKSDAARDQFANRDSYWKKLTRVRLERVEQQARGAKQNSEMAELERIIKDRMGALNAKLHPDDRRG